MLTQDADCLQVTFSKAKEIPKIFAVTWKKKKKSFSFASPVLSYIPHLHSSLNSFFKSLTRSGCIP